MLEFQNAEMITLIYNAGRGQFQQPPTQVPGTDD